MRSVLLWNAVKLAVAAAVVWGLFHWLGKDAILVLCAFVTGYCWGVASGYVAGREDH